MKKRDRARAVGWENGQEEQEGEAVEEWHEEERQSERGKMRVMG